jgi:mono/diheme cytochrome c family protein
MRVLMFMAMASVLAAQTAAPAGNAQKGKQLFQNDGCYQCHGREAQGGLGTGPRLAPRPIAFPMAGGGGAVGIHLPD